MCEAFLELMKPEFDAAMKKAVADTTLENKFNAVEGALEVLHASL